MSRIMLARNYAKFIEYFKEIGSPQQDEKVLYPLHEALFLMLSGVLGRAEDGEPILEVSESKININILQQHFAYKQVLPSISTLIPLRGKQKIMYGGMLNKHAKVIVGGFK